MLFLLCCLVINAIEIPKAISMKDMTRSDPSKSAPNMIVYYILSYKWYISLVFFIFVCLAMIISVSLTFLNKNKELKEEDDNEEIYLEGRKLLLPSSSIFKSGEKFHLSEEFEEKDQKKDSKDIFRETLITKLKLSYSNQ